MGAATPKPAREALGRGGAAVRRARMGRGRVELLGEHLGEEVVRDLVGQPHQALDRDRLDGRDLLRARGARRLTPAAPPIRMPRRFSAAASFFAANSGGRVWNALPFSRARPRLNDSALSGPTHVGDAIARVGAAAQRVEERLVAEHAARHAADAGAPDPAREPLERRAAAPVGALGEGAAAEARIAASDQVEVAAHDAVARWGAGRRATSVVNLPADAELGRARPPS